MGSSSHRRRRSPTDSRSSSFIAFPDSDADSFHRGCRPPAAAAREDAPPGPQGLWKKAVCAAIIVALTLFPAFYLLLFGVQQGKAMLKVWWISSMTSFALTAVFYEVVWRLMKRQSQRLTMPHEPASLVTVSLPPLFPLHSLHSRGSRSRSSSNSCCCRPCSGARSSSSPTQLSSCDSRSARCSMKAQQRTSRTRRVRRETTLAVAQKATNPVRARIQFE